MSEIPLPFVALVLWIVASAAVSFLPMRHQYAPGLLLLVLAPALIAWLAVSYGLWLAVFGAVAFLSMFRHPLRYLFRKAFSG